jgi:hypothetical protein
MPIPFLGLALTKPVLIGAAVVVAILLAALGIQTTRIYLLERDLGAERERYAKLTEKNARCEVESAGAKASLETQGKALGELRGACEVAKTTAEAAIKVAQGQRPATAKQIADILAGKPQDADLCKAACIEIRRR